MGCITSKTVITENPNCFDVIFADTERTVYYNAQLEINGKFCNVNKLSTIRLLTKVSVPNF